MSTRCTCTRLSKLSSAATTTTTRSTFMMRTFSSTAAPQEKYPPESPHWITVPRPRQSEQDEIKPPKIKGTLPTPRTVFKKGPHDAKLQPDFLERTAPKPTTEAARRQFPAGSPRDNRRRMAEKRRENLEAGVEGLWQRQQDAEARVKLSTEARQKRNEKLANAPERLDDVLTRSTILESVRNNPALQPDPNRFARVEKSREQTKNIEQIKAQNRRDAITALYMSASEFIVDEDELSAEVDRVFADNYFSKQARSHATDANNAWDVWGAPPTLNGLSGEADSKYTPTGNWTSDSGRAVRRQKSIAEDLTGGKMD